MGQIGEDFYVLQHGLRPDVARFGLAEYRDAVPVRAK